MYIFLINFCFSFFLFSSVFIFSLTLNLFLFISLSLSLLIPLPNSLPIFLSQTTTISPYLSISPFYSPYRCYFVIVSRYLTLSFTFSLFGATSDYSSLYLRDIIPLLLSFLLWYDYHNHCFCFCFNNYYFLACFVAR